MKISVFGLGYVGAVSAGCLAHRGHEVIGVDPVRAKVDLINNHQSPVIEDEIGEIIAATTRSGRLLAIENPVEGVCRSDLSFVCVGTPSQANGSLDLRYVRGVCEEIGQALRQKATRHIVVVRSTILPGTMRDVVIPSLENASGKPAGDGFGICYNPEFLREGSSVRDFNAPPATVIGELDSESAETLAGLFGKIDAPLIRTSLETAEMLKYVSNAWHALKIGFANEIGSLCKVLGIDGHELMRIFCEDKKLNISSAYLQPGFAFGGSCLPKDLRALSYHAKVRDLKVPILDAVLPSNELQIRRGFHLITERSNKRVGVLGFSFKAGTDDLRESPIVELIERLIGKGYDVRVYDSNVNLSQLIGANRDFITNHVPHIARLMVDGVDAVLNHAQTVVLGNKDPFFRDVSSRLREDQVLVDLVRAGEPGTLDGRYEGICW